MTHAMPPFPCLDDWRKYFTENFESAAEALRTARQACNGEDPAWISLITMEALESELERIRALPRGLPLFGVPFAVKDNIDAAGWETTAACPEYAYVPSEDATVVARLRAAGAVLIGKTNLDQFATGLVGTRSPYGAVPNAFDPDHISGGSSSGSAVVVARGLVAFSLGTDTAGSGRVPAGFNNVVGLKPTRGVISTRGVVPACASLDCVSIFALNVDDAMQVLAVASGPDALDPWSRTIPAAVPSALGERLGIPMAPEWHGDARQADAWERTLDRLRKGGFLLEPLDMTPFHELAALLYDGPWIAERWVAVGEFMESHPEAVNPVVRGIISAGRDFTAADCFRAEYRRQALLARIRDTLSRVDALLVPTAPTLPRLEEVAADPVGKNAQLGRYTNFVNLADLCALALPAGRREDGLPFGVTLLAPAWMEASLASMAERWYALQPWTRGISDFPAGTDRSSQPASLPPGVHVVAVVGAHLRGQPLNHQLTSRGARYLETTRTSPEYRLFALADTTPPKPGLMRCPGESVGQGIEVELWALDSAALGGLMGEVPSPLGIGSLQLADGRLVKGFICEGHALGGSARDITDFGGWRAFRAAQANPSEVS